MELIQSIQSSCPYCGESINLIIDCSIELQEYVEDCQVCCQPMLLSITINNDEDIQLSVRQENE